MQAERQIISEPTKVVAHLIGGSLVKGYLREIPEEPETLPLDQLPSLQGEVMVEPVNGGGARSIKLACLKALFFVKTFEGSKQYSEVKFFDKSPAMKGLWVRLKFSDGEVTEGIIHNSIQYVADAGFFMKPSDQLSNTNLTYVLKSALVGFQIIGVQHSV